MRAIGVKAEGVLGVQLASKNTKLSAAAQDRSSMMEEAVNRSLSRASDSYHERGAFQLMVPRLMKQVAKSDCTRRRTTKISHPSRSASGENTSQRVVFGSSRWPGQVALCGRKVQGSGSGHAAGQQDVAPIPKSLVYGWRIRHRDWL